MAKVEIQGVTRRYSGNAAATLDRIDLEVAHGEVLVLVGPSGCGKSTTLRLLAGLDVPDGGRIVLDGRDLASVPPQERDIAMVFQGYALYPHMTAAENMAFGLKMRGASRQEREKRVNEVAELLGITRLLRRFPDQLSGGERQRVAMGRALVRKPKLFLFDEPLSNLDAALRTTLRVEIARLLRRIEATAIYVTHDQIEAMTVGDRIAVMQRGRIEQLGRPREIYESPTTAFVAGFLGSPPINFLEAEIHGDMAVVTGKSSAADSAGSRVLAPAFARAHRRVRLAARPESLRIAAAENPADALTLRAEVVALEPLGEKTVIHLDHAGVELRALASGFYELALGTAVEVTVASNAIRWFDAETGQALRDDIAAKSEAAG